MIKSTGFLVISLFIFASLTDLSTGNETNINDKNKPGHKKEDKHEYYLNRHVDHPDVDAETIQKHGVSLEDAKMQADGLLETKKVKKGKIIGNGQDGEEAQLQEMSSHGEEKQHHQRRHHRHEVKGHKQSEGEGSIVNTGEEIPKKEEKKLNKNRKNTESGGEMIKSEEVKGEGSKDTETIKHTGGKRNHDKRRKGHKHSGASGHKNKKHGGKKSHKLGKPSKEKKDKKMNKNHHN